MTTRESEAGFYGSFGDVKAVTLDLAQAANTVSGLICYTDPDCPIPAAQKAEWDTWQAALAPLYSKAELRKRAAWAHAHEPELNRRFTQFVFTPELGHAAGAYHHGAFSDPEYAAHGEKSCPMRYWHRGTNYVEVTDFVGNAWDLTKSHDGTMWRWCKENLPQMRLSDQ
ncbi:hypothetical protein BH11MYX2_BH11MYX2_09030 [soil metagenome]